MFFTYRAIAGDEHVTRTEREPCYAGKSSAECNTDAEPAASHESHQRRSVYRPDNDGPRDPSPITADESPAAVMERRKAPWFGVHPGPAPRRNVHPVAGLIGSPSRHHSAGNPHRAVIRICAPVAVLVQIVVSIDIPGDISRQLGSIFALIARLAPVFEFVKSWHRGSVIGNLVGAIKGVLLTFRQVPGISSAAHFALAFAYDDDGRSCVRIGLDAIFASPVNRER